MVECTECGGRSANGVAYHKRGCATTFGGWSEAQRQGIEVIVARERREAITEYEQQWEWIEDVEMTTPVRKGLKARPTAPHRDRTKYQRSGQERHDIENGYAEWHVEAKTREVIVTPDFDNACLTRGDLEKMLDALPPEDEHDWKSFSCGEYGNDFRCSKCGEEQWIEGTGSFRGRGLPKKGCPGFVKESV